MSARQVPDEGRLFSLDMRSIAPFRALLGALILADLPAGRSTSPR